LITKSVVTVASLAKPVGGSGTTTTIPPLPSLENGELPYIFYAIISAWISSPIIRLNGDVIRVVNLI
jgi:hypothetical protein